jgi:hypothetical protein
MLLFIVIYDRDRKRCFLKEVGEEKRKKRSLYEERRTRSYVDLAVRRV